MRAIVLLNGQPPEKALLTQYLTKDCVVFCADGAANVLYPDFTPQVIMGDMDSIDMKVLAYYHALGVDIQRFQREKDETDGQLIIDRALKESPEELVILGGLGGRLDHTMGNIQLLIRCAKRGVIAYAVNERERIDVILEESSLNGSLGDTVSLIPLTENTVVSTKGMQYEVDHFRFPLDTPVGISNVLAQKAAQLTVHSGCIAAIHNLITL